VFLARRQPLFALSGLLFGGALLGSICVGHQFEPRYIIAFVCIEIVALVSVGFDATSKGIARLPQRWRAPARTVAGLAVTVFILSVPVGDFVKLLEEYRENPNLGRPPGLVCDEAYEFIRLHVDPNEPIVSPDPWLVVWELRRKGVIAPTNGADALEAVVRHYRTRWALVGPYAGGGDLEGDLARLKERGSSLRPLLVADSLDCKLYWLSL
jgi:hypothetical protein